MVQKQAAHNGINLICLTHTHIHTIYMAKAFIQKLRNFRSKCRHCHCHRFEPKQKHILNWLHTFSVSLFYPCLHWTPRLLHWFRKVSSSFLTFWGTRTFTILYFYYPWFVTFQFTEGSYFVPNLHMVGHSVTFTRYEQSWAYTRNRHLYLGK